MLVALHCEEVVCFKLSISARQYDKYVSCQFSGNKNHENKEHVNRTI